MCILYKTDINWAVPQLIRQYHYGFPPTEKVFVAHSAALEDTRLIVLIHHLRSILALTFIMIESNKGLIYPIHYQCGCCKTSNCRLTSYPVIYTRTQFEITCNHLGHWAVPTWKRNLLKSIWNVSDVSIQSNMYPREQLNVRRRLSLLGKTVAILSN